MVVVVVDVVVDVDVVDVDVVGVDVVRALHLLLLHLPTKMQRCEKDKEVFACIFLTSLHLEGCTTSISK